MKVGAIDVPEPDDDPAVLAALYSGYAYAEHWRKVVLATCKELVRGAAIVTKQRITEARIEDLARQHPSYLEFLTTHLHGRVKWEREAAKHGLGG
jgi:hypothetical protein